MKFGRLHLLLLVPAGLLMTIFIIGLTQLGWQSLVTDGEIGLGNYSEFFARSDYVRVLMRTIEISLITTLCSLLIGYPAAYCIARAGKWRNLLMLLVIMPWLVSLVVRTYGWVVLLGNRGTINSFLMWIGVIDSPLRLLFNQSGVVIGLVHVLCPFMIISILTVFMHIERSMEEASMILGAGPEETFLRVIAPLSLPGVISGCTIVFLLSTGAIITPLLLGGPRNSMLATQIYQDVFQLFDFPKASAMAFLLMASALIFVGPLQILEKRVLRHLKGGR
jgi:putative spermidine/putrescine transport system permease protein